ncbi:MAG: ParB/RepB/Spo0J family partition protein [Bacteroidales bacterium]|nr:ParB/RepB/Spo0J family partition protein [Bacteroidales bacterium]MDD3891568.1 ParB/RepB/Spo0J family partition protein [Bacteroidales bacterium]
MAKKMALGRGLGALIDDADTMQQRDENRLERSPVELVKEIDINKIKANPFQPRTSFDKEALQELSDSIKELGIIQPLTVRSIDGEYQLIAGERRLRAAKLAGLNKVPAYIRTADDQGMLEMALVENIQREDLDAIEVAISYQRLIDECSLTHDTLSERVGKKRATVTNYLRLLKLPAEIQLGIRERKLTMGHARAILPLENSELQLTAFSKIIEQDLSVRKVEELVRNLAQESKGKGDSGKVNKEKSEELNVLEDKLQEIFGWGVQVKQGKGGSGKIVISYRTQGELEELMERMNRFAE